MNKGGEFLLQNQRPFSPFKILVKLAGELSPNGTDVVNEESPPIPSHTDYYIC